MFRILKVAVLITILYFFHGCAVSYGNYNTTSYTPLTSQRFKNSSGKIDLYFEGTSLSRSYLQIGFIEVVGKKDASNEMLIDYLKNEAYQKGADAVMNVKKMFKNRETGLLFDQENAEDYSAPVFTGIAIKYTDRVPDPMVQTVPSDTAFKRNVLQDQEARFQRACLEYAISLLALVGVLVKVLTAE